MKTTTVRKQLSVLGALVGLLAFGSNAAQAAAVNVAPLGTASQSSHLLGSLFFTQASNANDGDTSGNWAAGDTNHTNNGSGYSVGNGFEWWSVALDKDYLVESIDVWNRTDCCAARLSDFTVTLFNDGVEVWSEVYSISTGPLPNTSFNVGFTGDSVRVQLNRQDYLHLAEVQVVFGTDIIVAPPGAVPEPASYALILAGRARWVSWGAGGSAEPAQPYRFEGRPSVRPHPRRARLHRSCLDRLASPVVHTVAALVDELCAVACRPIALGTACAN